MSLPHFSLDFRFSPEFQYFQEESVLSTVLLFGPADNTRTLVHDYWILIQSYTRLIERNTGEKISTLRVDFCGLPIFFPSSHKTITAMIGLVLNDQIFSMIGCFLFSVSYQQCWSLWVSQGPTQILDIKNK